MPSIEQCDASAGSVAALPSTLEIFDKFKPVSENGKDSDSEESFHLPLDDDEIESQSVVSNGRDKEIHNEETEEDILNKFGTSPSGTPDQIDSHVEDTILNDSDDNHVNASKENKLENTEKDVSSTVPNTEVKITYAFEEYEDSGDGEFKSIYETESSKVTVSNKEPKSTSETVEPMEVCEEPVTSKTTDQDHKDEGKTEDAFEDCMDVEQDETNQDIANIIEKLEDQGDTPVEDPEPAKGDTEASNDLNEGDVNMAETSDVQNKDVPENREAEPIQEVAEKDAMVIDDDVEMSSGDVQADEESQEPHKENAQQEGSNSTGATFQESSEKSKEDAPTSSIKEAEVQVPVEQETTPSAESECPEEKEVAETPVTVDDTELPREPEKDENVGNEVEKEDLQKALLTTDEETKGENCSEKEKEIIQPESKSDEISSHEENLKEVSTEKENDTLLEDSLLRELDETIKESDTVVAANKESAESNVQEEPQQEKEPEKKTSEEEVFKVPEEPEKQPSRQEEKEAIDLICDEKLNDKPDDDESDLLDISMVRETEEDDACAIADAIEDSAAMEDTDKETQASEKSDEEQSERVETEQENSDIEKDRESNDDNENDNAMGFDDLDDDSPMYGDDSSNTEAPMRSKNKIIELSESSKDSSCDNDLKQAKGLEKPSKTFYEADVEQSSNSDSTSNDVTAQPDETQASTKEKMVDITSEADDKSKSSDTEKTEEDTDEVKGSNEAPMDAIPDAVSEKGTKTDTDKRKPSLNKRSLSSVDFGSAKKPKLAVEAEKSKESPEKDSTKKSAEKDSTNETPPDTEKVKTLTAFAKFMQCRKLTAKLSRSDLEQFCIQKICEGLMLKSSEGELHQTIKKHEKTIETLRKDLQQLTKQCKDLEIVNKKLMNELKNPSTLKKPLVPLKITRSVGLQVRLNPGNDVGNQNRRRQQMPTTPQKLTTVNSTVGNRAKGNTGNTPQPTAVRQVMQNSPQKSPMTTGQPTTNSSGTAPMLTQALQKRQGAVVAKRTTTPVRKSAEVSKPANPGVIDLTDEDDKAKSPSVGSTIKIINKTAASGTPNKTVTVNKLGSGGKTVGKPVAITKPVTVGTNKGNTLSPGIRLTPASVITSSSNGSPQMVYVVPTITSNSGGQQKVAFVNFQPTNGVLSGSTVSVMSNKQGQTLTLKPVTSTLRHKHPAPLPTPPRINLDPKLKPLLPKPLLTIKKIDTGIILQWKMPYDLDLYENIASYQLYAYQETSAPPSRDMWRKVGDVKALALPMACTLTQFADKNKYYFAVRSVDVHNRIGAFSEPEEISL